MRTISWASIVPPDSELFPAITLSAINVESVQKQKNTAQTTKSRKYCARNDEWNREEVSQLRMSPKCSMGQGEEAERGERDVLYGCVHLRIDLSLNTDPQASEMLNNLGAEE